MDNKTQTTQPAGKPSPANAFNEAQLVQEFVESSGLAAEEGVQAAARNASQMLARADAEGSLEKLARQHGIDATAVFRHERELTERQAALREESEALRVQQHKLAEQAQSAGGAQLFINGLVAVGSALAGFALANKASQNRLVSGTAALAAAIGGYITANALGSHKRQGPVVEKMNAFTTRQEGLGAEIRAIEEQKCEDARRFLKDLGGRLTADLHQGEAKRSSTASGEVEQLVESVPTQTPEAFKDKTPPESKSDISTPKDAQGHTLAEGRAEAPREPVGHHTAQQAQRETEAQREHALA